LKLCKGKDVKKSELPKGVLFDMDGVLVDSEPFIAEAACRMFAEKGLVVTPEDFHPFVGAGENRYLGGVAEKYNLKIDIIPAKRRTYDIYLEIIKGRLKPLPGAVEFINKCLKLGKKIALASSADLRKVEGNLLEIGLSLKTFGAVVTGEDIEHKKPAPDIFLLASKRLGLDAKDCLVVEDAINGVAAAKAAGSKCLAITSIFSRGQLADADFFAANLAEADEKVLKW
jgi:beta-phosphoglucomutase